MKSPLVSVVMPTRNRGALLPRAVTSVLQQTMADLELIVVDDASSDDTPERLAELCAREGRIRVIRLATRAGAAVARNRGIIVARGQWLAFIDDDDEWLETKLDRQLNVALTSAAAPGLVYCPLLFTDAAGHESLQAHYTAGHDAYSTLLRRNFIDTSTVLVRRDLVQSVGGFDERLPRLQDWDLWIRLASVTPFGSLDDPLTRAYYTEGSISTSAEALVAACRVIDTKLSGAGLARREMADFQHALGHVLMIGGAPREAPRYLWRSARLTPTLRRLLMALLASAAPAAYRQVSRMHERLVRSPVAMRAR